MSSNHQIAINTLSTQEIEEIEAEIIHLPNRRSAAIDALNIVQNHRGWISDSSLSGIAKLLGMSDAELDGIATFYNLIYRKPVGDKVILVCDSVTCWMLGADQLCDKLKQRLDIAYGETTKDNKYTLLPVTCLGDCDHAPVMMVGDELHHDLDEDKISEIAP